MARKRLTMRKTKEILRLKDLGLSQRQIANRLNISHSTVGRYLSRIETHGLTIDTETDTLQSVLHPPRKAGPSPRPEPD